MAEIRLDKLLSDRAAISRTVARDRIFSGRVTVDAITVKSPEKRVDENVGLFLDGKPLRIDRFCYIMMNKPAGVVSATGDRTEKTVIDLLPLSLSRKGLFPVGRLDKDTTGLLILTDDGDYCHRVTHPKKSISKLYEARTERETLPEDVEAFALGLVLRDDTKCLPARLSLDPEDSCHCFVEIFEGKYHQIKRMFASRGNKVARLRRVSIGALKLDKGLEEGGARVITGEEASQVFDILVTK